ncbi:S-layer homology domain-containing protein [Paenisporosarcina sp. OV554]|uniref:S-layer homology domain-containing protein n=1 Tax=Paenisporosarcina sp. OV554 TaxID=2135694 RepID=UPI000D34342A|nr:S-layer homology domain-containing protein [Paenisporosarcina sp. OV554]PUB15210.1 S-layer family protein [Paenisporosarcina sp. OV554]
MVVRAVEYKDKIKLDNLEKPANFKDHQLIGTYAIDSVYKATALGVIKGNEGQFNPKNNATRAEAAVMLYGRLDTLKLIN